MLGLRDVLDDPATVRREWSDGSQPEAICDYNAQVNVGKENYFLSADGLLMPTKKDQPPPDLKYFKQVPK